MVIALVGLALAMVAGGAWAIVAGYAIISLERGWTFVIAGTAVAGVGMVLLGITAVVARLGASQAIVGAVQAGGGVPE